VRAEQLINIKSGEKRIHKLIYQGIDMARKTKKRVLKKGGKLEKRYLSGLSKKDKAKKKREIARGRKTKSSDPSAYGYFSTDIDPKTGKPRKTKTSKYTKKYKRMYGAYKTATKRKKRTTKRKRKK